MFASDRQAPADDLPLVAGSPWARALSAAERQLGPTDGLRYLAALLAAPDEEISALALEQRQRMLSPRPRPPERELHDARERARGEVVASIGAALDLIGRYDRTLAEHLRRTVTLGTFCCYRRERDVEGGRHLRLRAIVPSR